MRVNSAERASLCSFLLHQNGTDSSTRSLTCAPHWQPATTDTPALELPQCSGWHHIKPQKVKTTVSLPFSVTPKSFCPTSFVPVCYTSLLLFPNGSCLPPRNVEHSPDRPFKVTGPGHYSGCQWPRFIPVEKTGISIRTCPLLRTWIMLSVHRHYRSWNDRANERRAGRWVQDLLSLNQLTSRLRPCAALGERFASYGIHGIWMFRFCIRHHVLQTGHCIVTGVPIWSAIEKGSHTVRCSDEQNKLEHIDIC